MKRKMYSKKNVKNSLAGLFMLAMGVQSAVAQITVVDVKDSIGADTHWTIDKQYLLKGYVYVTNGHTLTIDKGVVIKGDKDTKGALIIERGAKILAQGTKDQPIVFTSNQDMGNRTYGDWGGVILCGKAPNNWSTGVAQVEGGPRSLYGGTDAADNSGVVSYVRIEFAGIAFSPNNEVNGLTLCSVGNGTKLDHIQVSYSGDDSFEWFGGTVNSKYIIAYRGWDDDFDTDNGYSGKNQFVVGLRDPFAADQSGSKAFESDSYQAGTQTGLGAGDSIYLTKCVFSNATIIGGVQSPTSTAFDPQFVSAAHVRRGSAISIMNSVLAGYPAGLLIDESSSSFGSTVANYKSGIAQFKNNVIAGIPTNGAVTAKEYFYTVNGARSLTPTTTEGDTTSGTPFNPYPGPYAMFQDPSNKDKLYATEQTGVRLQNPFNLANPNFVPTSTSPLAYNSKALPAYMTTGGTDPFKNGKVYPFDPTKTINTDTSSRFVNYNAPSLMPGFSSYKLNDPFFDKVNYVGAFSGTQTTSDNWMAGWTNFDPVNTDYADNINNTTSLSKVNAVKEVEMNLFPNPATDGVSMLMNVNKATNVSINIVDLTGKVIKTVATLLLNSGANNAYFTVTDVPAGMYFVQVATTTSVSTAKLSIIR